MTVRLAPIDDASTVLCIHLHVHRAVRQTSELYPALAEAGEYCLKARVVHPETVVLNGEFSIHLVEVQRQALVHEDRAEWPDSLFRPRDPKDGGHEFSRCLPVPSGNYCVIEVNGHEARGG